VGHVDDCLGIGRRAAVVDRQPPQVSNGKKMNGKYMGIVSRGADLLRELVPLSDTWIDIQRAARRSPKAQRNRSADGVVLLTFFQLRRKPLCDGDGWRQGTSLGHC
jgi:hypothetical protein